MNVVITATPQNDLSFVSRLSERSWYPRRQRYRCIRRATGIIAISVRQDRYATDRLSIELFIRSYLTFSLPSVISVPPPSSFQPLLSGARWSLPVVVVVGVVRGARIIAAKRSARFYSRQATRIVNVFGHYSRFC